MAIVLLPPTARDSVRSIAGTFHEGARQAKFINLAARPLASTAPNWKECKMPFNPLSKNDLPPAAAAAAARAHAERTLPGGYNGYAKAVEATNEAAWHAVCAKQGLTDAMHIRASGLTAAEAHNARKTMRRAINKIESDPAIYDDDQAIGALTHASTVISRLSSIIDVIDEMAEGKQQVTDTKVLRNQADFEKRFRVDRNDVNTKVESLADFVRGVAGMRSTGAVQASLSVGTDSQGGYAVPTELMPGILAGLVPASSMLQAGAGIIVPDDGAKSYGFCGVETIPTAAWRLEAGAVAESDPVFRSVSATPRSLAFMFKISRELLADGQGIEEALRMVIVQSFAKELDRAGLRGTGTAPEIRGLLNTSGIGAVTNGANGASLASSIKYSNLLSATSTILGLDAPMPTAAIMSVRDLVGINSLADTTGQPLQKPPMLDAVKLIGTSQIPTNLTVGTSTDCSEMYVGDFSKCAFVMQEQVSIQLLRELYAATGQLAFVGHVRVDLVTLYPKAFAKITGIRA